MRTASSSGRVIDDFHLFDRHHAVVHADDDSREVGRRKHGDRNRQRLAHADDGQRRRIRKMMDFE